MNKISDFKRNITRIDLKIQDDHNEFLYFIEDMKRNAVNIENSDVQQRLLLLKNSIYAFMKEVGDLIE